MSADFAHTLGDGTEEYRTDPAPADDVEALAAWVDSLWTTPCAHGGGYARDCTRCIHETLYRSDWLAQRDAAMRAEGAQAERERIAQAIEQIGLTHVTERAGHGGYERFDRRPEAVRADAARIARAEREAS